MKRQRGQAIILVLMLLAVGSLMIIPSLRYTATGFYSQRVSENALTRQYGADSALEDALWQMLKSIQGGGSPNITAYDFSYGTSRYPVLVQVPSVPSSQQLATGNIK